MLARDLVLVFSSGEESSSGWIRWRAGLGRAGQLVYTIGDRFVEVYRL